ncbi:MAG TPA: transporter substrate-binding domain-containing protein [Telluria sp.]|nr:transporter substrate-binding domain-containing protein [Telluria sp.]
MRTPSIRVIVLSALLALGGAARAEPALRIATSHLPPLAIEQSPQRPGALAEVVTELTRRAGIKARTDFMPWRRALFMSTHFPQTAIFPLTRTPEREPQYRWLAHLYHEQFVFFALKGAQPLDDVAALRARRVAILRGSAQIDWLRRNGYRRLLETASVEEGLRYLRMGIADVLFGDLDITLGTIRTSAPDLDIAASAAQNSTTTWLGGSLDLPADYAARFEPALQSMIDDGTYARIMKKYGLSGTP